MKENKSILDGVPVKDKAFTPDWSGCNKNSKPGQIVRMGDNGQVEWVDPPPGFWDHLKK